MASVRLNRPINRTWPKIEEHPTVWFLWVSPVWSIVWLLSVCSRGDVHVKVIDASGCLRTCIWQLMAATHDDFGLVMLFKYQVSSFEVKTLRMTLLDALGNGGAYATRPCRRHCIRDFSGVLSRVKTQDQTFSCRIKRRPYLGVVHFLKALLLKNLDNAGGASIYNAGKQIALVYCWTSVSVMLGCGGWCSVSSRMARRLVQSMWVCWSVVADSGLWRHSSSPTKLDEDDHVVDFGMIPGRCATETWFPRFWPTV